MRRTNSFSNGILYQNNNDKNSEKMFLSMKETLHHPLEKIKSKELLNVFYLNKSQKEKNSINNIPTQEIKQDNPIELINNLNEEESNNNYMKNYNENNNNNSKLDDIGYKNSDINTNYNKYKNKGNSSENIDFNTSPNTTPDSNLDKIENVENNIINTEPIKPNISLQNEKSALNEIKNIALNIKYKINSFKICENTSKISIEQTNTNNDKNNYLSSLNKVNINSNITNDTSPFEFFNYSLSNTSNNPKKIIGQDINLINKFTAKINDLKIELKKKEIQNEQINIKNKNNSKEKQKQNNYNYRNYIQNISNPKIMIPEDDIYTRSMAMREKKEMKLEQIRQKEMEEELKEFIFKPKINNISKKITKNKKHIYKRLKEIEIEKNNKIEKIKENINKNDINNNCKQKFNEDDFKKWLISNENWNVKKLIKLNSIKNEVQLEENLHNEEYKFHPTINKNSEKLFKSNYSLSSLPVSDRLCYTKDNKEQCSKKKNIEDNLTFIPKINKEYPISDKYYKFMEKDQFQIYKNLHNKNLK